MALDSNNWNALKAFAKDMTIKQTTKALCEFLDSNLFKTGTFEKEEDVKARVIYTSGENC